MRLTVNGEATTVEARPEHSLLHVLRENLGLTAAKPGCGEGECGACTVLVDGKATRSCVTEAMSVSNHEIETLERLRDAGVFARLVTAFANNRAFQCGYCTPGMVVAAGALLRSNANPTEQEIIEALDGNVCRCGTYRRIIRAVQDAAESSRSGLDDALGTQDPPSEPETAFENGAPAPWDLSEPGERDWFDRLGDGLVAVLSPDEAERVNEERGGAWSTAGGGWLHISPAGRVTAFTGKVDVGQDNSTALTSIVARELHVAAENVDLVMGDTDFCPYDIGTFGSRSTEDAGGVLAATAASARDWLDSHPGHLEPGTRVVIEALAGARADGMDGDGKVGDSDGGNAVRRSALAIASGRTRYTSDVSVHGMAHGRAVHGPVREAKLLDARFPPSADNALITTAKEPGFAGVVAPDPYTADSLIAAAETDWDARDMPSEEALGAYLRSHPTEERGWEGAFEDQHGDLESAMGRAAATYSSTFTHGLSRARATGDTLRGG